MADGIWCECGTWIDVECCCSDVDWTTQETIYLRAKVQEQAAEIESAQFRNVTYKNQIAELTRQRDEAIQSMQTAADQIRKCDYTPARSTLLVAIAAIKESQS